MRFFLALLSLAIWACEDANAGCSWCQGSDSEKWPCGGWTSDFGTSPAEMAADAGKPLSEVQGCTDEGGKVFAALVRTQETGKTKHRKRKLTHTGCTSVQTIKFDYWVPSDRAELRVEVNGQRIWEKTGKENKVELRWRTKTIIVNGGKKVEFEVKAKSSRPHMICLRNIEITDSKDDNTIDADSAFALNDPRAYPDAFEEFDLGFALDISNSMLIDKDFKEAIEGIEEIVYKLGLQPNADYSKKLNKVTILPFAKKNYNEFKFSSTQLSNLHEHLRTTKWDHRGGETCSENIMQAVAALCGMMASDSVAVVFTDASAKDYGKVYRAKSACLSKNIKVNFILRGSCADANSMGDSTIETLAEETGGIVLKQNEIKAGKLSDAIGIENGDLIDEVYMKTDHATGDGKHTQSLSVPIDGTMRKLVLKVPRVRGGQPKVSFQPQSAGSLKGLKLGDGDRTAAVLTLEEDFKGMLDLTIADAGLGKVQIFAMPPGKLKAYVKFAVEGESRQQNSPYKGALMKAIVTVDNLPGQGILEKVKVTSQFEGSIDSYGQAIGDLELKEVDGKWETDPFKVPLKPFRIVVEGDSGNGGQFRRTIPEINPMTHRCYTKKNCGEGGDYLPTSRTSCSCECHEGYSGEMCNPDAINPGIGDDLGRALPGDKCVPSSKVPCKDTNSECAQNEMTDYVCLCKTGYVTPKFAPASGEKKCLPTSGSPCDQGTCSSDCICVQGMCKCRPPKVFYAPKKRCLFPPNASGCQSHEQCGGNSQCKQGDYGNKCACPNGKQSDPATNQCADTSGPGESCSPGTVCSGGSDCRKSKCECKAGFVPEDGECKIGPSGFGCEYLSDCIANSECSNSQCLCKKGTETATKNGKKICAGIPPNGPCESDSNCVSGSCLNQKCKCNSPRTYYAERKKCLIPPQSTGCQADDDCVTDGYCHRGSGASRCRCKAPRQNFNLKCKIPPGVTGCQDDTDCGGDQATCSGSGKCHCPPGQLYYPEEQNCLFAPNNPAGWCQLNEMCGGGSICNLSSQKCECVHPQQLDDNKLECSLGCTSTMADCSDGQVCENHQCICASPRVAYSNQCKYPPDGITRGCKIQDDCGEGFCVNGVCICPGSKTMEDNVCKTKAGKSCGSTKDCISNTKCEMDLSPNVLDQVCKCKSGYFAYDGLCKSPPQVGYCQFTNDCGGGSYCDNGVCRCASDMELQNNYCKHKTTGPGKTGCQTTTDCFPKSNCDTSSGRCICKPYHQKYGDHCKGDATGYASCSTSGDCGSGIECKDYLCKCPQGKTGDGQMRSCVRSTTSNPPANPALCLEDSDCTGGKCNKSDGGCYCQENQFRYGLECKVIPSRPCGGTVMRECGGDSYCNGGTCTCNADKEPNYVSYQCVKKTSSAHDSCNGDHSCKDNAKCENGNCVCKINYGDYGGECKIIPGTLEKCVNHYLCGGGSFCDDTFHQCACGPMTCPTWLDPLAGTKECKQAIGSCPQL